MLRQFLDRFDRETAEKSAVLLAAIGLGLGLLGLIGGLIGPGSGVGMLLPIGAALWLVAAQLAKLLTAPDTAQ
jgi:hypothetical protein